MPKVSTRLSIRPIGPSIAYIPIAKIEALALVEAEDVPLVESIFWFSCTRHGTTYAVGYVNGRYTAMHRLLMGKKDPKDIVDHKNRNGLDNRRNGNLRDANFSLNSANSKLRSDSSTGVTGVTYYRGVFIAHIRVNGVRIHLGRHKTLREASEARKLKALEIFGEFSPER